jgi:hypothetical protein
MKEREKGLEPLLIWTDLNRKQAFKVECAKRNTTMRQAIEEFIDTFTGLKVVEKAA